MIYHSLLFIIILQKILTGSVFVLKEQIESVRQITDFEPEIAIVLGSGLGGLAENIDVVKVIPYSEIPHMPVSTAPTHKGQFVFGYIGDKKVVLMQGRIHLYEGYTSKQAVSPILLMRKLGATKLILTNAAGGINKDFNVGDFMVINDHISCFVDSALIGKNDDSIGTRFPDMSNVYDKDLRNIIKAVAIKNHIEIKQGVYTQLKGPQFETPAEIKMLATLGSDAVGMSTVIEAQAGAHCGFKVCGISLITNLACGILDQPLTEEEVKETGAKVAPQFELLIKEIVKAL